jgi:signal transduction histidine kinase
LNSPKLGFWVLSAPLCVNMLHEFIAGNRNEIIRRCRDKVATRSAAPPIDAEIDRGVPLFLDQLVDALRFRLKSNATIGRSAVQHGQALRLQGFTVSQVVHEYGDVCQAITELAVAVGAPISTDDFRTLNRCLDDAIASAVTEYARGQNQSTLDRESVRGNERLGFLAHELRNLINTAVIAFEVLKTGNVGVAGKTGGVLNRSLMGLRALIDRSLAEVRLTQAAQHREQFQVSGFIEEVAVAAALEADVLGITLAVMPIEDGVTIEADRQVLAAALGNLLQNAFKFTRPRTTVTLRVGGDAERVLIEVEDECGGVSGENLDDLFRPFEQRNTDRTGLGLGLALARAGIEANRGRIYARNRHDRGCVFTVELPRLPVRAVATLASREG